VKKFKFEKIKFPWAGKIEWHTAEAGHMCAIDARLNPFEQSVLKTIAAGRGLKVDLLADGEKTYMYCTQRVKPRETFDDNSWREIRDLFMEENNKWLTTHEFFIKCAAYQTLNEKLLYERQASGLLKKLYETDYLVRELHHNGNQGRPSYRYRLLDMDSHNG
jgi:hypothetical protein